MASNTAWAIGEIVDRAIGIPSASYMATSALIASFVLNASEADRNNCAKSAIQVAPKMPSCIQNKQVKQQEKKVRETLEFFQKQRNTGKAASSRSIPKPRSTLALAGRLKSPFGIKLYSMLVSESALML